MLYGRNPKDGKEECIYTDPNGSPPSITASKFEKEEWEKKKRRFWRENLALIKEWRRKGLSLIHI